MARAVRGHWALWLLGCGSTVAVTPDPLDDPATRLECPPGAPDPCGPGRHCIAVGPGFQGVCVRDGARGGLCRDGRLRCDEDIACVDRWCERGGERGPRTRCGARQCGLGEGCVELSGVLQCVAYGATGGYCREAGARCDPGLRCDEVGDQRSRCGRPLREGTACYVGERTGDFCADDTVCVGDGALGRCAARGQEGTPCRADGTCAAGLDCQLPTGTETTRCLRPVGQGGRCELRAAGAPRCAAGLGCASADGVVGTCLPGGVFGGPCLDRSPPCDDGLGCHPEGRRCVVTVPAGSLCAGTAATCVEGSGCVPLRGTMYCIRDGDRDGRCRRSAMPCDAGLRCVAEVRESYCRAG